MSFACKLHEAFVQNNVFKAFVIVREEKSSITLVDRLDEVVITELHKKEHKNVVLILRAIEHVIDKDEECKHTLVHHGLVVKMLSWFETVSEHLKEQHKPSKIAMKLIEVFYEVSMILCRITSAGSNKILDLFLLRFGTVVLDHEMPFCLRLEAIRTINSMLDSSPKDIRKKLCQSDDHIGLLENLAKALTDIGDYEMQVAISEALCRMTPKKLREDFAGKWFSFRSFASAFTSICDKDFETDCRTFLNELNSYFGKSRRVFSFPCIRVFLDSTELFKPEDEFLKEFWVDFNIGTSSISFFVNDPPNTLWELIHLPKDAISTLNLQDHDDQKILTVNMINPVSHGKLTGQMVKIIFSSEHNIQTALTRVFAEKIQHAPESVKAEEDLPVLEGMHTLHFLNFLYIFCMFNWLFYNFCNVVSCRNRTTGGARDIYQFIKSYFNVANANVFVFHSPPARQIKDISKVSFLLSGQGSYSGAKTQDKDIFYLKDHSDSEVARAKTLLFCQSSSSNGSTKSLPDTLGKAVKKRIRVMHSGDEEFFYRDTPHTDYSRKRPRTKGKLRVLPLSSPSSNEEEFSKYSTPKHRCHEKEIEESEELQSEVKLLRSVNVTTDSGFQEKTVVFDSSFPLEEADTLVEKLQEHGLDIEESHSQKNELESSEPYLAPKREQLLPGLKPKRLFSSLPLEDATERVSKVLEDESEEELGAGVRSAFHSFKTQLRTHFSNRYKKIEARSLQSLTDCQRNVTSLLGTVHSQRLLHLEHFQTSVVQQLECLEQNCLTLKSIEKETVNFWQLEANTVRAFCDRQQKRLDSLTISQESTDASYSLSESQETQISVLADLTASQCPLGQLSTEGSSADPS
ncbi:synaptonemal complex protein 2-like [Paramisgurnus dabryanus]|uniref:synaptonemal complex protein 2-like n=1 Tax=Paramisgurnus dabryanus TaxID=90735 RepID=UPI003CCF9DC7